VEEAGKQDKGEDKGKHETMRENIRRCGKT